MASSSIYILRKQSSLTNLGGFGHCERMFSLKGEILGSLFVVSFFLNTTKNPDKAKQHKQHATMITAGLVCQAGID